MKLTKQEAQSELWAKLRDHMQSLLDRARIANDNPALTMDATSAKRGEIKALKTLIALGEEDKRIEFEDSPAP